MLRTLFMLFMTVWIAWLVFQFGETAIRFLLVPAAVLLAMKMLIPRRVFS
jgi:hypothetical protein